MLHRRTHPMGCVARLLRNNLGNVYDVQLTPNGQTANITAATASAPNKIIEHVIQLDISPFSFVCRIISTPPERNRLKPVRSQKSRKNL